MCSTFQPGTQSVFKRTNKGNHLASMIYHVTHKSDTYLVSSIYSDHLKAPMSFGEHAKNITTEAVRPTPNLITNKVNTPIWPSNTPLATRRISVRGDLAWFAVGPRYPRGKHSLARVCHALKRHGLVALGLSGWLFPCSLVAWPGLWFQQIRQTLPCCLN